jgi:hypothetical protein
VFKSLKEKINQFKDELEEAKSVNKISALAKISDPLAEQIDWEPLHAGSSNFRSMKIIKNDNYGFSVVPTFAFKFILYFFIAIGFFAIYLAFNLQKHDFKMALFGSVFSLIGVVILFFISAPKTFDSKRLFYTQKLRFRNEIKIPYSSIYAFQLISKIVRPRDRKSSVSKSHIYICYELNLVLSDKTRVNLYVHGDKKNALIEAQMLAEHLGKPLWSVI